LKITCNQVVKLRVKFGIMETNNYSIEAGDTKIFSIKKSKITLPIERHEYLLKEVDILGA